MRDVLRFLFILLFVVLFLLRKRDRLLMMYIMLKECISQFAATDKNLFTKKQDRKLSKNVGTYYYIGCV